MQRWVVACFLPLLLCSVFADVCPNGGRCEDGQTCCQHPSDGYQCCPFDQGECCGDHEHCCPAAMSCDVEKSRCVNATLSVPWAKRTSTVQPGLSKSFRMIKSNDGDDYSNVCPDQSRCPSEFSCLRALTKYGCCPLAQGIPCSDGKHCCPQGHSCSEDSRSCVQKEVTGTVLCSDGVSECPEESSCCEGADGEFGCCPMSQAVCCDDKVHCCPEGSQCDLETSKCISISSKKQLPMWAKFPARRSAEWEDQKEERHVSSEAATGSENDKAESVESGERAGAHATVVTCDSYRSCPDMTTCCSNGVGGWGCCNLTNAVCCSNYRFCCPYLTTCDVVHGRCLRDDTSTPMSPQFAAVSTTVPLETAKKHVTEPAQTQPTQNNVVTPDERVLNVMCNSTSACPDGTTCCTTAQREWACCLLPNAVCCSDHMHCCPHGTSCDLVQQKCVDPSDLQTTSMSPSTAAISTTAMPSTTEIMQFTEHSLNEQTESQDDDDNYDDEDVDDDEDIEGSVHCKEGENSSCPKNSTCCGRQKKICCALPHAICCHDGKHCCPQKYRCHPRSHTCVKDGEEIPWYSKIAALPNPPPVYANGATLETKEIEQSQTEPPQSEQTGEEETEKNYYDSDEDDEEYGDENESVQCDHKTICPTGTTCCRNGNRWGCCPLPQATCCSDGKHCCPHSYKCSVPNAACVRDDNLVIPWYSKLAAMSHPDTGSDNDVKCSDRHRCPEYQTCCKLSPEEYGCCPMENAVCCSDEKHCCPAGFSCDTSAGTCVRPVVLKVEFVPLTPATTAEGGGRCGSLICPDDTKCCMNRGMPHCCKYKNGVCCDTRSCCPPGLKCGSEGGCVSDSRGFWENLVLFFQTDEDDQLIL